MTLTNKSIYWVVEFSFIYKGQDMKDKLFNVKVSTTQRDSIKKLLSEIKKINRYTYPEILLTALRTYRAKFKQTKTTKGEQDG